MDSIKIGAFLFSVQSFPNLKDDEDKRVDGYLDHSKSEILLDAELGSQAHLSTLLHEVVHEIAIQSGQDLNEGQVDAMAFGVIQVLKDNPELVRMITKG
jgi:hypothetical protein